MKIAPDHQLQLEVGRLLVSAPGANVGGEVCVVTFTEVDTGEQGQHVNYYHYGNSRGWSSEETNSLDLAWLAAECLAIRCGACLVNCSSEGEEWP